MRILFILALFALLAGVGVVALIENDPGYVMVAFGNYTIETSFWIAALAVLVLALLFYSIIRLVRRLLGGRQALKRQRRRRSSELTNNGLVSFIEGNWSRSRRQLLRGARHSDAPLLNYLVAARASHKLDDQDRMRKYLGEAERNIKADTGIAVDLTQAEIKLDAGQFEQAAATLVRARRNAARHPYVLALLYRAYMGLEDWDALSELLPDLERHRILSDGQLHGLKRQVYMRRLQVAAQAHGDGAVALLQQRWQELTNSWRQDHDLQRAYIALLITLDAHEEAGQICIRMLKDNWDAELVRLYAFVQAADASKQLMQAESWLNEHSQDAQLLLCLGRLAARNELWGKTRDYLERSYHLQPSAEVCAELGRLLGALGESSISARYYEEGLLRDVSLPTLPMPESADHSRRLSHNSGYSLDSSN
ncbi:MAG: heme biosynthesis HemY N-terminal domain-containing protein [Parahaliea sp.]